MIAISTAAAVWISSHCETTGEVLVTFGKSPIDAYYEEAHANTSVEVFVCDDGTIRWKPRAAPAPASQDGAKEKP